VILTWYELIGRLALAALLGGALGFEREIKGHSAGLRTHMLVSLGACLFASVGSFGVPLLAAGHYEAARVDITRVASQVVVGIGFLGGGVILRHGTSVHGLTTAANLWVAAALGLACAFGQYLEAIFATLLVLLCLVALKPLETKLEELSKRFGDKPEQDRDRP
jgi:putative Mg2+ transporter-C (MgtC) family protein